MITCNLSSKIRTRENYLVLAGCAVLSKLLS